MAVEATISILSAQTKGNPTQKQKKQKFKKGQFKHKAQEQAKPNADQKRKDHNNAQLAKKRRMNFKSIVCWECGKRGHPARLCKIPKKVISYNLIDSLVCTVVLAADTPCPIWFIDSGAVRD